MNLEVAQQQVCTHCVSMQSPSCSNKSHWWPQTHMYNMRDQPSPEVDLITREGDVIRVCVCVTPVLTDLQCTSTAHRHALTS
jgi:hypothetical protein